MMKHDIIESYIEKVYGYAVNHTYSRDEADELAQEILFTAVRELPRLRDESKFEPWLWSMASNVTKSFRRNCGKQRAMYSYDTLDDLSYEDEYFDDREEIYDSLRTKIAMLSAIYRDIIILHYYDGLSTKAIAERLSIPEGTVRWRLTEARRKLKKEYNEMEVAALRPKHITIGIYGSGNYDGIKFPYPNVYINDLLSKNILYHCYENALGIEELAKLCGVPAYYIEERLEHLIEKDAIIEETKGKYRTDFIIWSDKYGIYCEENAEKTLLPIMDRMIEALKSIAAEAAEIPFYKAGKTETDLFYLYGILAFEYISKNYCRLPFPPIKPKYDGYRWCYLGSIETGKHKRTMLNVIQCANLGSRGHYSHTVFCEFGRIPRREMMLDACINACEDILTCGHSDDTEAVALAVQGGHMIRKENGGFFVNVPAFTIEQKSEFERIVKKYMSPLMEEYIMLAERFIAGYKQLFPKHVSDDADRMCHGMFKGLYKVFIEYAQRMGLIEFPSPGYFCDVMLQFK